MKALDDAWAEMQPWLTEREARRRKVVRQFFIGLAIGAGCGVALAGIGLALGWHPLVLIIALLAPTFGGAGIGGLALQSLRQEVKAGLNTRLAAAFGLAYAAKPSQPARIRAFRDHGLAPGYDRSRFEDHFAGQAHGADFELYEAHLETRRTDSKGRTHYSTVFRGVLIRIAFPRPIEGVTLITRDKGLFNALDGFSKSLRRRALERIGLVDPEFEKIFEVYGTDQVMARYLLTPTFMERLLRLEAVLEGKNVRAVFDDDLVAEAGRGELLISAQTGDKFEAGSMFARLDDKKRLKTLYEEIALIDAIIQTLLEPKR